MVSISELQNNNNYYVINIKTLYDYIKLKDLGVKLCNFWGNNGYTNHCSWAAFEFYKRPENKDKYNIIELSEIEGFYEDKKVDMKYLIKILKKYNIR